MQKKTQQQKPLTETVFCVASGPSLTPEDCAAIEKTGCSIIAVNNTWQLFKEIYALFAGDLAWWKQYRTELPKDRFRKITANLAAAKSYALEYRRYCGALESFNSGAMAISLAQDLGAKTVILLGYDCSISHGTHWHGLHSGSLRNPSEASVAKWHKQFQRIREQYPNLQILNASRRSDLQCFPRINLNTVIASLSSAAALAR